MIRSHRSMLALLLIALFMLTLCGCSTGGDNIAPAEAPSQPATEPEQQPTPAPAAEPTLAPTPEPTPEPTPAPEKAPVELAFTPGTYSGRGMGNGGWIKIDMEFDEHAILSIEVTDQSETAGIGDTALDTMVESILAAQSIAVDTVSGATNTCNGIFAAVEDCVTQAGENPDNLK